MSTSRSRSLALSSGLATPFELDDNGKKLRGWYLSRLCTTTKPEFDAAINEHLRTLADPGETADPSGETTSQPDWYMS